MRSIGFLGVPEATVEAQRLFDEDVTDVGYVMNVSRLWAYQPDLMTGLFELMLTPSERAMADWARKVAGDPNRTSEADVQALRDVGYRDSEIFAITVLIALRIAFSTVNDALGTGPDAAFRSTAPEAVLDAVTFGRPIDQETSGVRHPTATANP